MSQQQHEYPIYVRIPDKSEIAGFVIGALPFVCNLTTTTTRTVNGQVVESTTTNYVALAGGALAILIALNSFRLLGQTAEQDKLRRIALLVALIVLGVIQLLRGFGAFA